MVERVISNPRSRCSLSGDDFHALPGTVPPTRSTKAERKERPRETFLAPTVAGGPEPAYEIHKIRVDFSGTIAAGGRSLRAAAERVGFKTTIRLASLLLTALNGSSDGSDRAKPAITLLTRDWHLWPIRAVVSLF